MGIGPWHLLALIIIVLVFFGPSRLPTLGKSVGEAIRGFKKGMEGDEIDVTENKRRENLNPGSDGNVAHNQQQQQPQPQQQKSKTGQDS